MRKTCFLAFALTTHVALLWQFCHADEGNWQELFNGKNLAGWEANVRPESFSVENGVLKAHGKNGMSHLFYVGESGSDVTIKDFELIAVVRSERESNSGIFFHTSRELRGGKYLHKGYEVQLNSSKKEKQKTGSLYKVVQVTESPVDEEEWFTVRVRVEGKQIEVFIDEHRVVDYTEPENPKREPKRAKRLIDANGGAIAIQAHDPDSVFYFKTIRIREISAEVSKNEVPKKQPNIVFLFADDLGYGDLSCYGHPYARTPTLDKLASEGTRFTRFYVSGVTCCPSRTGFMTGLHAARFQEYPAGFGFGGRTTVTQLLKKKGYHIGHFGKWHIGPDVGRSYGVDEYGPEASSKGDPRGRDAAIFDAAVEFIGKNKDRPFYLNVWGHITHYAVNAPDDQVGEFRHVTVDRDDFSETMQHKFDECERIGGNIDMGMREYLAEVRALDSHIRRVLDAIDSAGLSDDTIVVFSSDHGPAPVLTAGGKKGAKEYSANMLGYAGELRGGEARAV
ncbi:MAG: sulfatase-like hydrolase/transferase [Planctomycetota bacterium]